MKTAAKLLAMALSICALTSCGGGGGGGNGGSPSQPAITSVTVTCSPTSIETGHTSRCTATVSGMGSFNSSVTWSVDNGTIEQNGNYTAPASATTATVKATSSQDATKSGTAPVAVTASIDAGAFNYIGNYPAPVIITYTNISGQRMQVLAYPGQVQLFANPATSTPTITSLARANGGTVIGQIPLFGYYLISVTPGNENTFITSVNADPNVIFANPNNLIEKADLVDLSTLEGPHGELPTVPNLKAQVGDGVYLYIPDDYVNTSINCGGSLIAHGNGTNYVASHNLFGTGQDINIFAIDGTMARPNDVASANAIALQDMTFNDTGRAVVNLSLQGAYEDTNHNTLTAAQYRANERDLLWNYAAQLSALARVSPGSFNQTVFVISSGNGVGDTGTSGLDLTSELQQLHASFPLVFPSGQGPHMIIVGGTQPNSTSIDRGFNYSTVNGDIVYAQAHQVQVNAFSCTADGTSFAAPAVANLIASVLAAHPNSAVGQITFAIMNAYKNNGYVLPTVDDINSQLTRTSFNLLTSTSGSGSGGLVVNVVGTSCGTGCSSYSAGIVLQLTASVNAGSTFAGWSGACSGTGTCTVTMNQDQTVTADFEVNSQSGGLTGTWKGNVTESGGGCAFAGTMSWALTQTGTSLSGTASLSETLTSGSANICGTSSSGTDTLQGSVNGSTISLTGAGGETFKATVNGTTLTGTGATGVNPVFTFSYTLTKQ